MKNLLFIGFCLTAVTGVSLFVAPHEPVANLENSNSEAFRSRDFRDVLHRVNSEFSADWRRRGLQPTPRADDLTLARRIALAMVGSVPSLEELRVFRSLAESDRIPLFAENLLQDRRHSDYLAERLARTYVGVDQGPFLVFRRRRFVTWLSDQLNANTPYDELVRRLITADGLWTDSPEVNFITVTLDNDETGRPDPVRLAGRTTRAFLGVRLDCMQCHDDNLDGHWLQSDFHELAAFYATAVPSLVGIRDDEEEYVYQYLHESSPAEITPSVPDLGKGTDAIPLLGMTKREKLANWVTNVENRSFSRAMVNRVWALAFGRPLVEPIDDIPLEGPFPPGFETLANDFSQHGYDLRRLWRIIVSTDAFQRDSRAEFDITTEHEDAWAAFPVTRLRPEQVAGAIMQAGRLSTIDANSHILVRLALSDGINKFVDRYGDMGQDEFDQSGGTIPQRLIMLNGKLLKESTRSDANGVTNSTARIAAQSRTDEAAIEAAYLAVLTRVPTDFELAHFQGKLQEDKISRAMFFEDLFWTLFNTTEFSWNH